MDDAQGQRRLGIQLLDGSCNVISTLNSQPWSRPPTQNQGTLGAAPSTKPGSPEFWSFPKSNHGLQVRLRTLDLAWNIQVLMPLSNLKPGTLSTISPPSLDAGLKLGSHLVNFYCPGTAGQQLPFLIPVNQLPMLYHVINNKKALSSLTITLCHFCHTGTMCFHSWADMPPRPYLPIAILVFRLRTWSVQMSDAFKAQISVELW